MQASVVIPVWNGASVITDCLDSLQAHGGEHLHEIICVDNASHDASAEVITTQYPGVRLLRQPANLGFSGGVNAGAGVSSGEVIALLNQDCVVHPGWLATLCRTLEKQPEFGIAGCTILNADGTVNHTGAEIERPWAYGRHLTEAGPGPARRADFVTGAALAISRPTWQTVGRFDEGFYPGYFEDADYCYRARSKGIETAYVPQAQVTHLFSSRELQADPVGYMAVQHRGRYRFVAKHWTPAEVAAFFPAEQEAVAAEENLYQALARVLAARQVAGSLDEILDSRGRDLGARPDTGQRRQLEVGFLAVARRAFQVAEALAQVSLFAPPLAAWQAANAELEGRVHTPLDAAGVGRETRERWRALREREQGLLDRIYFHRADESQPETARQRIFRRWVLRPLSLISGRDYYLRAELGALHSARLDLINEMVNVALDDIARSQNTRIEEVSGLVRQRVEQTESLLRHSHEELRRRLALLESLVEHDQP